jgi:LPS-assembly protein
VAAVRLTIIWLLFWLLGNQAVLAAEYTGLPTAPTATSQADLLCDPRVYPAIPEIPELEGDKTHLQADQADISRERASVFRGNVVIQRGKAQLEADRADYDYLKETLDAEGNIRFTGPGLLITGTDVHADMKNNTASFNNTLYYTTDRVNGTARSIALLDQYRLELDDATYTSCDPLDPDWQLSADKIHLDRESQQGTAQNMVLRFKKVPFFYFPYVRFPISEERLSGFLYPTIGSSDKLGAQFQIPYYWNIAPNYDATFTPWYMAKRGTMLKSEFRYLHSINQGELLVDYLNKDNEYLDETRSAVRWQHAGNPFKGWSTSVDYNRVSDTDYLLDFGNSLNVTSTTHLTQQGKANYEAANWQFTVNAQRYQTLSGSTPYERMPQLLFNSHLPQLDNRLHFGLDGEWVQYAHQEDIVQGQRLDFFPSVSLPLSNQAGFLTPKLAYRFTQYDLTDVTPGSDPSPSRSLPTVSLDSGLFFERDTRVSGTALQQTLEPRLFYVYTPYRDQDALPVFDTQQSRFNINEPIKTDFFDGPDRVEDANRLTALLTTRYIRQNTGAELFMAGIGQIHYFAERLVTMPLGTPQTRSRSNIIAILSSRPSNRWFIHYDTEWNTDLDEFDRHTVDLSYNHTSRQTLKAAYRYERDNLETAEAGFDWQFTPRWRFHGSELYDLLNDRNQEAQLGLRFDSCCWGLAFAVKERFITDLEPPDTSFYIELELKGLSSISTGF